MTGKDKIGFRDMRAVTVAILLILLAFAAILVVMDVVGWIAALSVVLIGVGIMLVALSFVMPGGKSDYAGASLTGYNLAWGILLTMAGVTGLVHVYADPGLIVEAAIMLIAVAIVILIMVVKNKGE